MLRCSVSVGGRCDVGGSKGGCMGEKWGGWVTVGVEAACNEKGR